MNHPWTLLLVASCVVLAGCTGGPGTATTITPTESTDSTPANSMDSSPAESTGSTPTSTTQTSEVRSSASYPDGWDSSGIVDVGVVRERANRTAQRNDYTSTWVVVLPAYSEHTEAEYQVNVLTTTVDHDSERFLAENRHYGVSKETAMEVVESGTGTLSSDRLIGVEYEYANSSAVVLHSEVVGGRSETSTRDEGSFRSTRNQPLPVLFQQPLFLLDRTTFANSTQTEEGFVYHVAEIDHEQISEADGRVVVSEDGTVTEATFSVTQDGQYRVYEYRHTVTETSVSPPEWS